MFFNIVEIFQDCSLCWGRWCVIALIPTEVSPIKREAVDVKHL